MRAGGAVLLTVLIAGGACIMAQSVAVASMVGSPFTGLALAIPQNASTSTSRPVGEAIQKSIDVNGVTRTFLLYLPHNYRLYESALIIALHGRGGGGPGAAMEQSSKLDEKADREGFAIAYLDGLPDATGTLNWNYLYDLFFVNGPDDVSFVREVIDSLQTSIHPDRRRIYATGTSAGGFMAQRVGVELSGRVAAIGVVEGGLFVYTPSSPQTVPNAAAPISVLFLKGDKDPNNQYCGAVFPTFGIVEASSDQDFAYWTGASADRCSNVHRSGPLCESVGVGDAQGNVTPGTPSSLVTQEATDCEGKTEVKFYRLLGGVDQWNLNPMNIPGVVPFNPDLDVRTGTTTNDILWNFFEEHPKHDHEFGDR
jgi:poly(3-hydroxybutyrate) depolymerase